MSSAVFDLRKEVLRWHEVVELFFSPFSLTPLSLSLSLYLYLSCGLYFVYFFYVFSSPYVGKSVFFGIHRLLPIVNCLDLLG